MGLESFYFHATEEELAKCLPGDEESVFVNPSTGERIVTQQPSIDFTALDSLPKLNVGEYPDNYSEDELVSAADWTIFRANADDVAKFCLTVLSANPRASEFSELLSFVEGRKAGALYLFCEMS